MSNFAAVHRSAGRLEEPVAKLAEAFCVCLPFIFFLLFSYFFMLSYIVARSAVCLHLLLVSGETSERVGPTTERKHAGSLLNFILFTTGMCNITAERRGSKKLVPQKLNK